MHLACAVGSRTVAILQSPSFDHWGPPEDGVWVYEPRGASAEEVLKVCLAKIRSTTSSWGDSLETRGDGFFKPSLTA
jgi:hypothetical protein